MTITSLISKNSRVQVFIDGKYSFSCTVNFVVNERLFVDKQIDSSEDLFLLKQRAIRSIAKHKLEEYASRAIYSKSELRVKLNRYLEKKFNVTIDTKEFDNFFKHLLNLHLFDESRIISNHINILTNRKKGRGFIKSKLSYKGFTKEEVENQLNLKDQNNYEDQLKSFISHKIKLLKPKSKSIFDLKQKVIKSALSRVMSIEVLKSAWIVQSLRNICIDYIHHKIMKLWLV